VKIMNLLQFSKYLFVFFLCLLFIFCFSTCSFESDEDRDDKISREDFFDPPISARPGAFWPWLNGHVSLDRISYELEEMKKMGMSGADIWDVKSHADPDSVIPAGPPFLGDESLAAIAHAEKETRRLGLELGMIAASGWNAGGTWIKPKYAGMGMFSSELSVHGPDKNSKKLTFPEVPELCPKDSTGRPVYFREIAVLAFPIGKDNKIESIKSVIDISSAFNPDNEILTWKIPAGEWKILRMIMANTGYQLIVPSPNSQGPMIDFLSPDATKFHFEYIVKRLESVLGPLGKSALRYLEVDSMELGEDIIWTREIITDFRKQFGYDPLPYFPLLSGWKLNNTEIENRFFYDWKKHISNTFIKSHYVTGTQILNKYGLKLCAEAGGPGPPIWDSCPVEALKALGSIDILRGEFWPKQRNMWLVKEIASAAHIYGKTIVDAESFTSWRHWQDGPYFLKQLADNALCEGLNHFTFHTFTHSPDEAGLPGFAYHAGTHINPNRVWWPMARPFIDYLSRCCYLLQKGLFVADVCHFYGDQAPNFAAPKHLEFSPGMGYDYDDVNSDVILNRMSFKDGKLYLPDGMNYSVLVLPQREDIPLDVLQKLEVLIGDGATVVGPKPIHTNTMTEYPERDNKVKALADRIWGDCDGVNIKEHRYKKGKVIWNRDIKDILNESGLKPDFQYQGMDDRTRLDYIHRKTESEDFYFINNRNERWESVDCTFRISDEQPELWNPETGEVKKIPVFKNVDGMTHLSLHLKPAESVFILFRDPAPNKYYTSLKSIGDKGKQKIEPVLLSHSATPGGPMWLSDGVSMVDEQYITFDLGLVCNLRKIKIWNYNENIRGFMNWGVKDVDIQVSRDGVNFSKMGSYILEFGPQKEDKNYSQDIIFKSDGIRYVKFDVKTNHSTEWFSFGVSKYTGLSKVKFFNSREIVDVRIHSISSGKAFDPGLDIRLGALYPDAEIILDKNNVPFLKVWNNGTYILNNNHGLTTETIVDSISEPLVLDGVWQVSFPTGWGAPETTTFEKLISWTDAPEDGIRYFSGRAVYRNTFALTYEFLNSAPVINLDLGKVQKVARVKLNGKSLGTVWKPPFLLDISNFVHKGSNDLEVEVANTWTNRLIGDAFLPVEEHYCQTNMHSRLSQKDLPLQPSGLLGPVKIYTATLINLQ